MHLNVDDLADVDSLLEVLDEVERIPQHIEARHLTYEAIPGGAGVDVGCGHGLAVDELAARGVPAVGVDRSDALVQAARRRFPAHTFIRADATSLPFPDHSLRWYRAERVFQHVPDPLPALAEARRVLGLGGLIVTADQDYESTVISSADPLLTRKLISAYTNDLANGRAGSRMRGLLAQAGFTDISVRAYGAVYTDMEIIGRHLPAQCVAVGLATGSLTSQEADAWMADLKQRSARHQFLLAYVMFITTARAPGVGAE